MYLHRFPTIRSSVPPSPAAPTGRRMHGKCGGGADSLVQTTDLVDELWQDWAGRRAIRCSCTHVLTNETVCEDIIYAFHDVLYPPEMDTILAQHKSTIQHLVTLPHLEDIQHLPVGCHRQQQGRKASLTGDYTVKYCGDLTAVQQAQVAHWIFDNIEEAQETVRCILEADPDYPRDGTTDAQEEFVLEAARTTLLKETGRGTDVVHTDVDLECLLVFEQRLFEKSAQSGSAGKYQWDLDAVNHQDGWDLYAGFHPTETTRIAMKEIPITALRCYAC
ncbi:hypothetical protein EDB19DRAFT_1835954 [Suillus lakei]|nr:hypothetical protein EDB19DRAFT_1835954 [Suillus lakei]